MTQNRTQLHIKLSIMVVGFLLVLPLCSSAAPMNNINQELKASQPKTLPVNQESFQNALQRVQTVVDDTLEKLQHQYSVIESNTALSTDEQNHILSRLEQDIQFFQEQDTALDSISAPAELRVIADRVFAFIQNHKNRVKQIRENVIAPKTQEQISLIQEKSKTIVTKLEAVVEKLETAGADTTALQTLIQEHQEYVDSLSSVDTSSPESVKTAVQTIRTQMQGITTEIRSLISALSQ